LPLPAYSLRERVREREFEREDDMNLLAPAAMAITDAFRKTIQQIAG
jgi:hypothetical protein